MMRQVILSVLVLVCLAGYVFAQYPYYESPETGSQTILNQPRQQTVVNPPMTPVPQMGQSAPPALIPPTENFKHGWRQTWTHEFKPFSGHMPVQPSTQWYPQQQQTSGYQWYYNASTGCWQRNVPHCQQPVRYYHRTPRYGW